MVEQSKTAQNNSNINSTKDQLKNKQIVNDPITTTESKDKVSQDLTNNKENTNVENNKRTRESSQDVSLQKSSPSPKKTKVSQISKESSNIEKSTKRENRDEIIEEGTIYFLYRPKVEVQNVKSLDDVQKMLVVMNPKLESDSNTHKKRVLNFPKKKLPKTENKHEVFWCVVEDVETDMKNISEKELSKEEYETKTRGMRTVEGARPVAEGTYNIVKYMNPKKSNAIESRLSFVLVLPKDLKGHDEKYIVQKDMNIESEGTFLLQVKNPKSTESKEGSGFKGLSPDQKVSYPDELQSNFKDNKFAPLIPSTFLDFKGCEMIIVGCHDDVKKQFDEKKDSTIGKDLEQNAEQQKKNESVEKMEKDLNLEKNETVEVPLKEGEFM